MLLHPLDQEVSIMDPLRPAHDLLAAHEEVVAVAVAAVGVLGAGVESGRVRRGHGVEGPDGERVLVQDVEVCVVFLEDEAAEALLVGGAAALLEGGEEGNGEEGQGDVPEVVKVADFDAIVAEHFDAF